MKMIRNWWVALAAVVFVLSTPALASALFIYNWSGTDVQVVSDPEGDSRGGLRGTDIVAAYHAYDATNHYHYFRMDLAAAPTEGNAALTYGFYIDWTTGGAPAGSWGTTHPNVPLPGTDLIILSATNAPETPFTWDPTWVSKEWVEGLSNTNGNRFYFTEDPLVNQFQYTEGGGTILEWRVDDSNGFVGSNFTWMAATVGPTGDYFKDTTVVPIPSAVWLLGSGIIGLIGLKRRRGKEA